MPSWRGKGKCKVVPVLFLTKHHAIWVKRKIWSGHRCMGEKLL